MLTFNDSLNYLPKYYRLKEKQDDLSSLCETLSVQTNARVAHLSGLLPVSEVASFPDVEKRVYDFSASIQSSSTKVSQSFAALPLTMAFIVVQMFSRIDVSRGFTSDLISSYEMWLGSQRFMTQRYPQFFSNPSNCTYLEIVFTHLSFHYLHPTHHSSSLQTDRAPAQLSPRSQQRHEPRSFSHTMLPMSTTSWSGTRMWFSVWAWRLMISKSCEMDSGLWKMSTKVMMKTRVWRPKALETKSIWNKLLIHHFGAGQCVQNDWITDNRYRYILHGLHIGTRVICKENYQ